MSDIILTGDDGSTIVLAPATTPNIIIETKTEPTIELGGALVGPPGLDGADGQDGVDGQSATISVGTTTTLTAGSDATVTNSGTESAAQFDFGIPRGADGADGTDGREVEFQDNGTYIQWRYVGDASWTNLVALADITGPAGSAGADGADGTAATVSVGSTSTLPAGSSATVSNSGTSSAASLDFGIPKGSDGLNGTDGKTVLNGSGAPSSSTGADGDFYIDTTAYNIYGPKTSGAWGSGTSLVGPAGSGTGDMLKSTYDPNNVLSDAFNMDNMEQGTNHKFVTAAELTVLSNTSGTNTGDQDLSGYLPLAGGTMTGLLTAKHDVNLGGEAGGTLAVTDQIYGNAMSLTGNIDAANLSGTNTGDQDLSGYATTSSLASVATSGSYNDLSDKPTIPTGIGDLSDVDTSTNAPTDGQVLGWVAADNKWEPTASGGGITWVDVTATTQTASVNSGYIANNAALVTITLPSTAAVGDVIRIAGAGAGGWKIAQPAGDNIVFGTSTTTTGTGGSLASVNQYDAVELLCIVANTTWAVISSQGNITVT